MASSTQDRAAPEPSRAASQVVGAALRGSWPVSIRHAPGGRFLRLTVRAFDKAGGVGGTWYWNRYPGALSDTESFVYRYSFDKDLLQEGNWSRSYLTQPEILAYLEHVVERYDLGRDIRLDTGVEAAVFDEARAVWEIRTDTGETFTARYLVTALGLLSKTNLPDIPGRDTFAGELVHTGARPEDLDITGKRVGVIGTGSTGTQFICAAAPVVEHLTVFQRSAQYSAPSGNRPVSASEIAEIKADYDRIRKDVRDSAVAFGCKESEVPAMSVSEEERRRVFQENWDIGGGFRFMFGTFCDIATDPDANEAAASFIRSKIAEITPKGVRTADGVEHELDVLVFATGFDAVDGNHTRMDLRGRGGRHITDHWRSGPTGYLGISTAGFPSMFMILGPNGPFTNLPPSIEVQVEWISDLIKDAERSGTDTVEATREAEAGWTATCKEIADMTLFPKAQSWIFGASIPGKTPTVVFYLAGLKNYRAVLDDVTGDNYRGFRFSRRSEQAAGNGSEFIAPAR
ncbi:NAD(P)/FAD-dependent oxidoreductase [Streptomyces macrosporus]|uniref:NAD(P)/FAD-dependent oxidoreductase n=1 Tax=Streptomyces macrosporus TaxID=44032 RepID=A0ABP5WEV0_9ACTN